MSRAALIIHGRQDRERAADWLNRAPVGSRVEFKGPARSLPQNSRMWAMLTDIATQQRWHGVRLSTNDWKVLFLQALNSETRMVPNLAGDGFVNLGRSSSDLSVGEMSAMIELMHAWGADPEHRVLFRDDPA